MYNRIIDNEDDGIEFRLHDYDGPTLRIEVRDNLFDGNGEDGIQLIDYPSVTDRIITIRRNIIANTAMAGLGFMSGGDTVENYRAAQISEPIYVLNNTFSVNTYGLTGGGSTIALNNIFVGSEQTAILGLSTLSHAIYTQFGNNGTDHYNSLIDELNTNYEDPFLDADYRPGSGSSAIDAGVASFSWNGTPVLSLTTADFNGSAPDIGAVEAE
ncbi:MAG: hypothetical protein ACI835_003864 [Planctomycetota bacterium]|jgi:hypothetical protein